MSAAVAVAAGCGISLVQGILIDCRDVRKIGERMVYTGEEIKRRRKNGHYRKWKAVYGI
jgi:hypothetical protein